jgi:hypothetical protein
MIYYRIVVKKLHRIRAPRARQSFETTIRSRLFRHTVSYIDDYWLLIIHHKRFTWKQDVLELRERGE